MNLLMIPRLALKALRQNVLQTALTMLGIIIGVGAVICVVAIGEGAQASVERAITNIGANMIWVEAGGVNRGGVRTGARSSDVLRQYLVEAVMLSLTGAAIGIGLGMFGASAIADTFQWPTRVSSNAIALAFGCSAAVGVFFGYYPARQAARLDPIEALRFE
jgi:putative ABC transport system permease protein